jgi:hypothetical protein
MHMYYVTNQGPNSFTIYLPVLGIHAKLHIFSNKNSLLAIDSKISAF